MRVCSQPGCPNLIDKPGRCAEHQKAADKRRGTSTDRGYTSLGHQNFRRQVLARDPICILCRAKHSTVADHYPKDRRELVRLGLNPNDPQYGRGLCASCHGKETAEHQPGGWNISPGA